MFLLLAKELLLPALINYGTDYSGNKLRQRLSKQIKNAKGLLQNHDLTHLIGGAIALVVMAEAERINKENAGSSKKLKTLAKRVREHWPELVGRLDLNLATLEEANIVSLVRPGGKGPPAAGVNEEDWLTIIDLLGLKEAFDDLGSVCRENLLLHLDSDTPLAVRELLKHDAEHGGKAFAAYQIEVYTTLLDRVSTLATKTEATLGELKTSQQDLIDAFKRLQESRDGFTEQAERWPNEKLAEAIQAGARKAEGYFIKILAIVTRIEKGLRDRADASLPPQLLKLPTRTTPTNLPGEVTGYVQRKTPLGKLRKLFEKRSSVGLTQALARGDGGYGKSVLAWGYADRHAADYPGGVFIIYCDKSPPVALLAGLADQLFVDPPDEKDLPAEQLAALVARTLSDNEPALLICDNINDAEHWARFEPWLPTKHCHRLITTRCQTLPNMEAVQVDRLTLTEARDLLANYNPMARKHKQAVDRIVGYVDRLAVAVAAIGAQMEDHPNPDWEGYADKLQERGFGDLLEDGTLKDYTEYEHLIGTVLDDAVDALEDRRPGTLRLLQYAALLPRDIVPRPWLVNLLQNDSGQPRTEEQAGDLIDRLVGTLLTRAEEEDNATDSRILRLHRLHRERLLARMENDSGLRQRLIQGLIRLGNERGKATQDALRGKALRWELAPLLALAVEFDERGEPVAGMRVTNWGYKPLSELARWAELRPVLSSFASATDNQEHDREEYAKVLSHFALIEQDLGHLESAREAMQRVIDIGEKAYDPDHPTLAIRYSNMALILKDLGHLESAREAMQRAIEINEKAYEPEHPTLATSYSNMATILHDLGQLEPAREAMQRAIEINEKAYEPDHPMLATSYSNMATILKDLGQLEPARGAMQRAIEINEKAYEPDHPMLATSYSNMALILQDLGQLEPARETMQRVIKIKEKAYEPDHPTFATSYNNLAWIDWAQGQRDQAVAGWRRALAIFRKHFPDTHPHNQTVLETLQKVGVEDP